MPLASRDPQMFLDVTKALCKLSSPDPTAKISLKREALDTETSAEKPVAQSEGCTMQVDSPTITLNKVEENAEAVVHFLLNELLRAGKASSECIKDVSPQMQAHDTQKETTSTTQGVRRIEWADGCIRDRSGKRTTIGRLKSVRVPLCLLPNAMPYRTSVLI